MKSSYLPEDAARLFASLDWRSKVETVGYADAKQRALAGHSSAAALFFATHSGRVPPT